MKQLGLLMLIGIVLSVDLLAQVPVRDEDHFWRKRVVRRIDLGEKINQPLVYHESHFYSDGKYTERNGIVAALISGLERQEFVAYDPDDWTLSYDYGGMIKRMEAFEKALMGESERYYEEEEPDLGASLEEFGFKDTGASDEWGSYQYDQDGEGEDCQCPDQAGPFQVELAPYEGAIHVVEDWIFNKARSNMQRNIDYFEVIWTDPTGSLPEKVLARFMWKDVQQILGRTQWKNRFNDAEVRSIKEVMELRIYHGYAINVGGEPIQSLSESAQRENEIMEFEHHLWSY